MKTFITVLLLLSMVGIWIYCGIGEWFINRDTTAILDRAQVSANAEDMLGYVEQLQSNMESRGMTGGHAAVIFKTPTNNMALIYHSVVRIGERLITIKDLPKTETTYQVAIDDLRGTLRELDLHASGWFWRTRGWWLLLISVFLGLGAAGVVLKD